MQKYDSTNAWRNATRLRRSVHLKSAVANGLVRKRALQLDRVRKWLVGQATDISVLLYYLFKRGIPWNRSNSLWRF